MKINNKDLRKLYKAYIQRKKTTSRRDCISPKKMINIFRLKSSENKKTKALDHITNCSHCAHQFEFILNSLRYENSLNNEIGKLLISEKRIPYTKKTTSRALSPLKKEPWLLFSHLPWKYIFFIVVVIFLASALALFYKSEKQEYRGENSTQILMIEPENRAYSKSQLIFKWKGLKNADFYTLELFNEALLSTWKSGKIYQSHMVLPIEATRKLAENNIYFWSITAFFPDRNPIESKIKKFKISE